MSIYIKTKYQIFLLIACTLGVLWAVIMWSNLKAEEQGLDEVRRETAALALLFATHADSTFKTVDHALVELRQEWLRQPSKMETAIKPYLGLLGDAILQVGVIDAKGYVAYTSWGPQSSPTYVGDREYFQFHEKNPDDALFVSRPIKGRATKTWSIQLTRPVLRNGQFLGVVVISVDPNYFVNFYQRANLGLNGAARMVRDTGEIMARSSDQDKYVGVVINPTPYATPGAPLQGSFRRKAQADGVDRLSSYVRLPQYGLTVIIGPSVEERLVPVRAHQRNMVVAGTAITLFAFIIAWLLLKTLRREVEVQRAIKESEEKFRALFLSTSEGVALHRLIKDEQGKPIDYHILDVNPAFEHQTGLSRDAVLNKRATTAYGVEQAPFLDIYSKVAQTGRPAKFEHYFAPLMKHFSIHVFSPARDEFATVFLDITQNKLTDKLRDAEHSQLEQQLEQAQQSQKQLQMQVLRDPLTGLYNRRYMDEILPREIARAKREEYPLSFIMLDLDHFKRINDRYGHAVGDVVLKLVATQVRQHLRESDIVCRYGGEEFLIAIAHATACQAFEKVEQIRQKIASTPPQHNGESVHITVSAGIAAYPEDGQTFDVIVKHADAALYKSKQDGRNRTTIS